MTDECWSHLLRCKQGAEEGSLEERRGRNQEVVHFIFKRGKAYHSGVEKEDERFFFSLYKTEDLPLQRTFLNPCLLGYCH